MRTRQTLGFALYDLKKYDVPCLHSLCIFTMQVVGLFACGELVIGTFSFFSSPPPFFLLSA